MAETYKITFAGVAFRYPNADVIGMLDRFGFPSDFEPERVFPGPEFQKIGFQDLRSYPAPKLNQWFYPVGASRTSVFRGLMSAADIEDVKAVVWASATPIQGTFIIQNDTDESNVDDSTGKITASLWMLPPIPIINTDLFVVTLVDERYFWDESQSSGTITCTGATSDWSEILDQIETSLQITLTYDAISSDYGYPDPDSPIYSNLGSPAVLLDAVAANVGCCVVRSFAGAYSLVRWSSSHTSVGTNRPLDDNGDVVSAFGGQAVDTDGEAYRSVMPQSVLVVFPKWVDGSGYYEPESKRDWCKDSYGAVWTYDVTLATMGTPYSAYSHNGCTKILRTTAKAQFTAAGDASPNNATACQTLAIKLAKDYCDARKSWVDETYRGIRKMTPEGVSDLLFRFDDRLAWTRVIPPPFNSSLSNFQHSLVNGGLTIPSLESTGVPVVTQICVEDRLSSKLDDTFNVKTGISEDTWGTVNHTSGSALSVTVPSGAWTIKGDISTELKVTAATDPDTGYIKYRLYNQTAGAAVTNTERMGLQSSAVNDDKRSNSTYTWPVSPTVETEYRLQAYWAAGATVTVGVADCKSNSDGWTHLFAEPSATSIKAETQLVDLPSTWLTGDPFCETLRNDCCAPGTIPSGGGGDGADVTPTCCGGLTIPGHLYVIIKDPSNNLGCSADGSVFVVSSMATPACNNYAWQGTLSLPDACGCTGQSENNFIFSIINGISCTIDWCATVGPPNCYMWELDPAISWDCTLPVTLTNLYLNIGGVQSGPFDLEIFG